MSECYSVELNELGLELLDEVVGAHARKVALVHQLEQRLLVGLAHVAKQVVVDRLVVVGRLSVVGCRRRTATVNPL